MQQQQGNQAPAQSPLSWVSPEFVIKTQLDLQTVCRHVSLLRELLAANPRSAVDPTARELASGLQEIQRRLVRLVGEISASEPTSEALIELCLEVNEGVAGALQWYAACRRGSGVGFQAPAWQAPAGLQQFASGGDHQPQPQPQPQQIVDGPVMREEVKEGALAEPRRPLEQNTALEAPPPPPPQQQQQQQQQQRMVDGFLVDPEFDPFAEPTHIAAIPPVISP